MLKSRKWCLECLQVLVMMMYDSDWVAEVGGEQDY